MVLGGDGISQIIYFVLFFVLIFLYPKLMLSQMINKIQKEVIELEKLTEDSVKTAAKAMGGNVKENMVKLRRAMEFFASPPISPDPSGIVPKFDKLIKEARGSFVHFVEENTKIKDIATKRNVEAAIMHSAGNHQIAKMVNHFLGIVKKYKNLQIAMIIQMQLPMIRDIAKAINSSVKAFVNQDPVGDGLGPLVVAEMAGNSKVVTMKSLDSAYSITKIDGRRCIMLKGDGPGVTTGYIGDAAVQLMKKYKPNRIITVDAAQKMEGEKSGLVADGVGVVMNPENGIVERFLIEGYTTKKNIPIDAVIVRMGNEEAYSWMPEEVVKAVPEAIDRVREKIRRAPKGKTVMIIGVGNTVGVPNNNKGLNDVYDKIKKNAKRVKKEKEEAKKKGFFKKSQKE